MEILKKVCASPLMKGIVRVKLHAGLKVWSEGGTGDHSLAEGK